MTHPHTMALSATNWEEAAGGAPEGPAPPAASHVPAGSYRRTAFSAFTTPAP